MPTIESASPPWEKDLPRRNYVFPSPQTGARRPRGMHVSSGVCHKGRSIARGLFTDHDTTLGSLRYCDTRNHGWKIGRRRWTPKLMRRSVLPMMVRGSFPRTRAQQTSISIFVRNLNQHPDEPRAAAAPDRRTGSRPACQGFLQAGIGVWSLTSIMSGAGRCCQPRVLPSRGMDAIWFAKSLNAMSRHVQAGRGSARTRRMPGSICISEPRVPALACWLHRRIAARLPSRGSLRHP
jgi:hypothetical protein